MDSVINMFPQEAFAHLRTKYRALYDAVKANHEEVIASGRSTIGHGFDHALMVAQYCIAIAENDRDAEMAWTAALMHNTDRHWLEQEFPGKADEIINTYLGLVPGFLSEELIIVFDAVHKHSKMNDDRDSAVLRILKDADRLANSGPVNIFRCALHNHSRPAFILEELSLEKPSEGSTFKNPRSCFDAFFFNEEWRAWLRMPKAILIGQENFDYLQQHQRDIASQLGKVGLYPFVQ